MARVRPFAAWRYASSDLDLSAVTAPPYDVVGSDMRAELCSRDARNVVALELPQGPAEPDVDGNRYAAAATVWDQWRANGVLARDPHEAVYVLEQRFELNVREVRRRAFIVAVGLEPFDAGIVIPHERTLPKALGDRFELIKATGANFSQVFGLFDDPACSTDALFDAAMAQAPVATATDSDGVVSTLWAEYDPAIAAELTAFMAERQIFIADGHHRYTTALAHRDLRRTAAKATGTTAPDPAYDDVMMALVNMDDPDLAVLPYHRIADGPADFDPMAFRAALAEHFEVTEISNDDYAAALAGHDRPAFLVKTRADERPYLAALRADIDPTVAVRVPHSDAWKQLDVAVLQELVLWPLLGIHPDRPETLERLSFTRDAAAAFEATVEHDVAFVLRATRLDQLRTVSLEGEIMPQKSTYFYPKLLSGLVFRDALGD